MRGGKRGLLVVKEGELGPPWLPRARRNDGTAPSSAPRTYAHACSVPNHPQGVEAVDAVMQAVAANNAPPIPTAHVRGFQDAREIDEYLAAHPETVRFAGCGLRLHAGAMPRGACLATRRAAVRGAWVAWGAQAALVWGAAWQLFHSHSALTGAAPLAGPSTLAQVLGSVVFSADPQRPTSLGFTVQTNSSVQWFKGKYQDPNTYMQVSGWGPCVCARVRVC